MMSTYIESQIKRLNLMPSMKVLFSLTEVDYAENSPFYVIGLE